MLAAAGDDTSMSSTQQPKARAARIIEHRCYLISWSTQTSLCLKKKELTVFCENILDTYVHCNIVRLKLYKYTITCLILFRKKKNISCC